jgi:hypothetical protein
MAVKIELPEDIEHHLEKQWGDLPGMPSRPSRSKATAPVCLVARRSGGCLGSKRGRKSMSL